MNIGNFVLRPRPRHVVKLRSLRNGQPAEHGHEYLRAADARIVERDGAFVVPVQRRKGDVVVLKVRGPWEPWNDLENWVVEDSPAGTIIEAVGGTLRITAAGSSEWAKVHLENYNVDSTKPEYQFKLSMSLQYSGGTVAGEFIVSSQETGDHGMVWYDPGQHTFDMNGQARPASFAISIWYKGPGFYMEVGPIQHNP